MFLRTNVSQVSAVITDVFLGPGQAPASTTVCQTETCNAPADQFCFNSASVGTTDCGTACNGGSPWTKYKYLDCYQTGERECERTWAYNEAVYSTADKCSDGSNNPPPESYLRSGHCDGSIGGIYKTCCSNTTPSLVTGDSCVAVKPFSGAPFPPYDGVCPAGTTAKRCGDSGFPPCGQSACGPTTPPPPPIQCGATCTYSQADSSGNVTCHSGNCTDGSQNCSFNSNCSYVSGCSSGSVVACPAGPPPPPPDLTTFKGISANGSTSCYQAEYTASLSWSGTSLPSSDSSCPNGYWVDIVQGTSFSGGFYHKCVQNSTSTSAPAGFGGFNGATGNLIFQKGQTYSARVYNGSHSNPLSLAVPGNACHS